MEELLQRYIRGEVSEKERREVALWLNECPENMLEFIALRKLYDISLWNTKPNQRPKNKKYSFQGILIEALKIAVVLLIGFFGAKQLMLHSPEKVPMQTIHVPAGQRAELTLSDGTQVWLNSRSTLKFPERFTANTRKVELDGEGYFVVQHNENKTFTVQTKKYAIHVLGTEFNVKAYHDSPLFETALVKGSVEISSPDVSQKIRLRPNELANLNNGMLRTSPIANYNYFKWKEGIFCFEDESIQDLIEKLQLYYDITIEVQRPSLLKYHYSGKFRIQDGIEHVLKVLQLEHKFTYTKNDEDNLIIIK